jgi:hypothetical protein
MLPGFKVQAVASFVGLKGSPVTNLISNSNMDTPLHVEFCHTKHKGNLSVRPEREGCQDHSRCVHAQCCCRRGKEAC